LKDEKKVCIIPARGGSKRLPRKNVLPLAGKPLLAYTIEMALNSQLFDDVFVSSEDEEILNIAEEYKAIPFKRESDLAKDTSTVFQVFYDFLQNPKNKGKYDVVTGMLPTCPFKTSEQIKEAMDLFFMRDRSNIISVTEFDYPIQFGFSLDDDEHLIMNHPEAFKKTTRSQGFSKNYHNNGAFWIADVKSYLKEKTFYSAPMVAYLMNAITSFDIDYPYQFEIAEIIAQKKLNEE